MSSVEAGRIGPKLESSPTPQINENSAEICYCPECGARLRVVAREAVDDGDRSTLPDWLPASPVSSPLPVLPSTGPIAFAALKADGPPAPAPIGNLPAFSSLPALPSVVDDDDEPTRVVRSSAEFSAAIANEMVKASAQQTHSGQMNMGQANSTQAAAPKKPPVPVRRHHLIGQDSGQDTGQDSGQHVAAQRTSEGAVPVPMPPTPAPVGPSVTASAEPIPENVGRAAPSDMSRHPAELASVIIADDPPSPPVQEKWTDVAPASVMPAAPETLGPVATARDFRPPPKNRKAMLSIGLGIAVMGGLAFILRERSPSPQPQAAIDLDATTTKILAAQPAPEAAITEAAPPVEPSVAPPPVVTATAVAASRVSALTQSAKVDATRSESKPSEPSAEKPAASPAVKTSQPSRVTAAKNAAKPESAEQDEAAPVEKEPEFDAEEAASALDSAAERATSCRQPTDPSGTAVVTITFAPSGRVTTATIAGPPFLGTATGSCIASTMRGAKVPAFSGKFVTVRKTVTIH